MSNYRVECKILVDGVDHLGVSEKGWRQYRVQVNQERLSSPTGRMGRFITMVVPPTSTVVPEKGDQLKITMIERDTWRPIASFFNGLDDYQYNQSEGDKEVSVSIEGEEFKLYKMPSHKAAFFEVKIVLGYYNPIDGQNICRVLASETLDFDDNQVDSVMFAVYERIPGMTKANCIGDWYHMHKAWNVFDYFTKVATVRRKLSKNGN